MTARAESQTAATRPLRVAQAVVVLFSWFWAFTPGFGLIDLETAIPPGDPEFRRYWFYEGTWGVLVTALIVVPLLASALRPGLASNVTPQQAVLVGCFTLAGLLCLDPRFLLLPIGLGLSTWAWAALLRPVDRSSRLHSPLWWPLVLIGVGYLLLPLLMFGPDVYAAKTVGVLVGFVALTWWLAYAAPSPVGHARRLSAGSWALLIVVLVAAVPWLAYANQAASHARAHDYIGSLIDRLVAQAAFPICLLALLIAAVIGWLPIRLAAWPAAVASAGFGFLAIWYPEHQGSPGADWGTAVLAWSACLAVVTEVATRSRELRPSPPSPRPT